MGNCLGKPRRERKRPLEGIREEIRDALDDVRIGRKGNKGVPSSDLILFSIHEKLSSLYGLSKNSNQVLCLVSPGIGLNPDDYDDKERYPRPLRILRNESRLADRVVPVGKLVQPSAAKVSSQYRRALKARIPVMNPDVHKLRSQVRQYLWSKPNDKLVLPDPTSGLVLTTTVLDLWHSWSTELNELKAQLNDLTKSGKPKNLKEETQILRIQSHIKTLEDKKMVLMSEEEMNTYRFLFSAGGGEELMDALRVLKDSEDIYPDGTRSFPVVFEPNDWYKHLASSFSERDLNDVDETHWEEDMVSISDTIANQLAVAADTMDVLKGDEIPHALRLVSKLKKSIKSWRELEMEWENIQVNSEKLLLKVLDYLLEDQEDVISAVSGDDNNLVSLIRSKISSSDNINKDKLSSFNEKIGKPIQMVWSFWVKNTDVGERVIEYLKGEASMNELSFVEDLRVRIDNFDMDSERKKESIMILQFVENIVNYELARMDRLMLELRSYCRDSVDIGLSISPDKFSHFSWDDINNKLQDIRGGKFSNDNDDSSAKEGRWFKANFDKIPIEDDEEEKGLKKLGKVKWHMSIELLVTVVRVHRPWLHSDVFRTSDFVRRIGPTKASIGSVDLDDHDMVEEVNDCVFPCFPVGLLMAKDVKITVSASGVFKHRAKVLSRINQMVPFLKADAGSKRGDNSGENKSVALQVNRNSFVMRIPEAKVIGYFQEFIPEDKTIEGISPEDMPKFEGLLKALTDQNIVDTKATNASISNNIDTNHKISNQNTQKYETNTQSQEQKVNNNSLDKGKEKL